MKQNALRLAAIVTTAVLLTAAYVRIPAHGIMAQAANNFLASLTPEQRTQATFKFDEDERLNWHFIPRERKGLPLRDMQGQQKVMAHALLAAGLSQIGYIKATTIMSLDDILRIMEKDAGQRRNAEGYYFSVFGEPGDKATWGFRVEGHHLAQNWTIINGKVADSPSFFGTNPALVKDGPRQGLRVLGGEEDLGRDLVTALDEGQRKTAIVDKVAYKDILTAATRKAALTGQPSGLPASKMNAKQFAMLIALIEEYANNVPEQLAQVRMDKAKKAGKNIFFAWAGALEKGAPHYYRIQAPAFMIEFDNVQNGANHVHSVWRDFEGDFGLDLLKAHYQTSHR